ncbi:hypothetical protein Nham_3810 [Nitrobacter hamburgensis X14]|uniref:Uncharacterized protein n=1 Tax=Nitrobacter hamburgensis (strain DSM 10229 / NCIMB 13809 / X14) TaxID=323097 RepID=Q1QGX7_NITHX|nr:hypothetical protein [Nitrobacter hamburgensis]ABE64520.1 hypothetical protein Nham_3810 [Nitrobacter hamburgensis X14]
MRNLGFNTIALLALAGGAFTPAVGQQTLPNSSIPLSFGMDAGQVSQALGVPLNYVRGRPGDELYLAIPNVKGSALASRSDGLYLQFRRGQLKGWKGDWGTIRPSVDGTRP